MVRPVALFLGSGVGPRCMQDRAATAINTADAGMIEVPALRSNGFRIVRINPQKSFPAASETRYLPSFIQRAERDRTDTGVEARYVSAACEYPDMDNYPPSKGTNLRFSSSALRGMSISAELNSTISRGGKEVCGAWIVQS